MLTWSLRGSWKDVTRGRWLRESGWCGGWRRGPHLHKDGDRGRGQHEALQRGHKQRGKAQGRRPEPPRGVGVRSAEGQQGRQGMGFWKEALLGGTGRREGPQVPPGSAPRG